MLRVIPLVIVLAVALASALAPDPCAAENGIEPGSRPLVEVIAGTDSNGDGGPAADASFVGLAGLVVDGAGNAFLSDSGANRVRRIDAASGIISTIAGTGTLTGSRGSDLLTLELQAPGPLALNAAGTVLFVGEVVGKRILRIDLTSRQTQDLGAPSGGWGRIAGLLWTPYGLVVSDAALGEIFLRRTDDSWTRMLPTDQKLRQGIRTMAMDPRGYIYISEYFAHRVLRLDMRTGELAVLIGTGEPGYRESGEVPTEPVIRSPDGLVYDGAGGLLIADSGNRRIIRVDLTTGKFTTLRRSALDPAVGEWTPGSIALDARRNLWVTDSERDRTLVFASESAEPRVLGRSDIGDGGPATDARLSHPSSVVTDREGNIYISDTLHHRIRVVSARDGRIDTIAGTGVPGYNGDNIPALLAALSYPAQIQIDGDRLYVSDYYNNRIRVIDLASSQISTLAGTGQASDAGDNGPAIAATLANPHALFLDSASSSLLVTSGVSSSVRRLDLKTGTIETVATDQLPQSQIIHGIGTYDGGLLLIMPRPGRIDLLKNGKRTALFTPPDISFPYHSAVASDGALFICDTGNNRVLKFQDHRMSIVADGLNRPRGISLDRNGDILVAETFRNRVLRIRQAQQVH